MYIITITVLAASNGMSVGIALLFKINLHCTHLGNNIRSTDRQTVTTTTSTAVKGCPEVVAAKAGNWLGMAKQKRDSKKLCRAATLQFAFRNSPTKSINKW